MSSSDSYEWWNHWWYEWFKCYQRISICVKNDPLNLSFQWASVNNMLDIVRFGFGEGSAKSTTYWVYCLLNVLHLAQMQ